MRFFLNGKETLRRPFNVSRAVNPEEPDDSSSLPMKRFRDDRFGIGFELPSTWSYRLTPSKDYLFEGPKGTEAFEVSVILQFVTKAANPGLSAAAQSRGVEQKLSRAPNGAIEARDSVEVDGTPLTAVWGDLHGGRLDGHAEAVRAHADRRRQWRVLLLDQLFGADGCLPEGTWTSSNTW